VGRRGPAETLLEAVLYFAGDGDLNGCVSVFDGRDFKDGDESLVSVVVPLAMAPGVTAGGFGVLGDVKNLDLAPPHGTPQ
jgi:hypothetical protein